MDTHRPRLSVLSLFDPLSKSPNSLLDKENNVGDSSFFHPHGLSNARTPIQPSFRRRLIDVGDMTIDDSDIHDLQAEEEEFEHELNCSLVAGDDDNDTLTFRDMAKAATPKWSGRHYTSLTTPKSSPIPRTPLVEISFKDETTPMARKKPYRRPIPTLVSKMAQVDFAEAPVEEIFSPIRPIESGTYGTPSSPLISTPPIELSLDNSQQQHRTLEISSHSVDGLSSSVCTLNLPPVTGPLLADISIPHGTPEASSHLAEGLSSSVCTLNLPPASGALITDTSIPVSIAPSSPRSSPKILLFSPTNSQMRLRPNSHSGDHLNRRSVDLQSSFQLHLSSSDTTFDLLNEKISFFSSKDGNSFLNNMELDGSFGEDDFGIVKDIDLKGCTVEKATSVPKLSASSPQSAEVHKPTSEERAVSPLEEAVFVHDNPVNISKAETVSTRGRVKRSTSASEPSSTPNWKELRARGAESPRESPKAVNISAMSSGLKKDVNLLSTPGFSSGLQLPPRAVPALKIVKRFKPLVNAQSNPSTTTTYSRRTSIVTAAPPSTSRNHPRSPRSGLTTTISENKQTDVHPPARGLRRTFPVPPTRGVPTPVDGPRRVLISESPKPNPGPNMRTTRCLDQTKSSSATNGPRRIVIAAAPSAGKPPPVPISRVAVQSSSGLKQPAKYATVGPVFAIPKPVTRIAGSTLPGPSSSKARFGVPTTGVSKPR